MTTLQSSLTLDARHRAMLAEMGVRTWVPHAPAALPVTLPVTLPAALPAVTQAAAPLRLPLPVQAPDQALAPAPAPLQFSGRIVEGLDRMDWPALREAVAACRACALCDGRRQTVFGAGDLRADWLIVGEAPDEDEDRQGEPFAGPAGQLLDNMLKATGLSRGHKVFITNALKCRPPANRNPQPEEVARCEPFLQRQVALLQPKIILAMGRFAAQSLLQTTEPMGRLRGKVHEYQGVPVVVTYHPAKLLHNQADKGKAWADLCLAMHQIQLRPD
jgi:uracil-DNA glycosylase family 4